jgi:hypothetical protein
MQLGVLLEIALPYQLGRTVPLFLPFGGNYGLMIEIAIINKDGWTRAATISPEGPKSVRHFSRTWHEAS